MALQTKTISANGSKGHHKFTLTVTENSTSVANNSSSISFSFVLSPISSGWDWNYSSSVPVSYSLTVGGSTYSGNIMSYDGASTVTVRQDTFNVTHSSDGTKNINYSFNVTSLDVSYLTGSASASSTMALTTIPRAATLTSAPSFTDRVNPTITYSNPAGNNATSLQACITSADGGTTYVAYRDIPKTGTSYTFPLTGNELTTLWRASANTNTLNVRFSIKTVIGSNTYYSYLEKAFVVTDANPTLSPTLVDSFPAAEAFTGNTTTHIRYFSNIDVSAGAQALKEATIKSYKITCGSQTITTATGTFTNIESGTFVFSVTDSRGNTTTQTINRSLINYIHLTCNVELNNPDATGNMSFTVKGNYFNGSFGTVNNTLTLRYRYRADTGSYSDWRTVTATLNGNTYSYNGTITGLDYRSGYYIDVSAGDRLSNADVLEIPFKSMPVFDWGESDFNFNVPVTIQGWQVDTVIEEGEETGYYEDENGLAQNGNYTWTFRKWSSGLLECWCNCTISTTVRNNWGSYLFASGRLIKTNLLFPREFIEVPVVNASLSAGYAGGILMPTGSSAIPVNRYTTGTLEIVRGGILSTSQFDYTINYQVKGKWK